MTNVTQTREEQENKPECSAAPSDPGNTFNKARCQAAVAKQGFSAKGGENSSSFLSAVTREASPSGSARVLLKALEFYNIWFHHCELSMLAWTRGRPRCRLMTQSLTWLAPRSWWLNAEPRDPCSGKTALRQETQTPLQRSTAAHHLEAPPQPVKRKVAGQSKAAQLLAGSRVQPRFCTIRQNTARGSLGQHPHFCLWGKFLKNPSSTNPPKSKSNKLSGTPRLQN